VTVVVNVSIGVINPQEFAFFGGMVAGLWLTVPRYLVSGRREFSVLAHFEPVGAELAGFFLSCLLLGSNMGFVMPRCVFLKGVLMPLTLCRRVELLMIFSIVCEMIIQVLMEVSHGSRVAG
jgi:hypothetical protein